MEKRINNIQEDLRNLASHVNEMLMFNLNADEISSLKKHVNKILAIINSDLETLKFFEENK